MILNPEISGKKTGSQKERNRIIKQLESVNYTDILGSNDLDH